MKQSFLSIRELKADARELFITRMFSPIFVTIVYTVLNVGITSCSPALGGSKLIVLIICEAISFILTTFLGLFHYGLTAYYMNYTTNRPASFLNLFQGFSKSPDKILLASLILSGIQYVCLLPHKIYTYLYVSSTSGNEFLISLGILCFCSLLSTLVNLRFEPVYYILIDLPELPITKVLSLSFWMMKGQVMKLFGLKLSFLPLILISIISFGIGLLWVVPYMNIALCLFYLDLSSKKSA